MNIRQQLNIKLSQNLVMTQSLQQAIKLLQLSKIELESLIRTELEENPVLEEEVVETAPTPSERKEVARESVTSEVETDPVAALEEIDLDYYFADYIEYQHRRSMREEVELPAFDSTLAQPTTLRDHLEWQLNLTTADPKKIEIGWAIFGNLNKDGYLRAEIEEIAQMTGASEDEVKRVQLTVQKFDPVGVASRSVQECLRVQLLQLDKDVELPLKIIDNYLGHLEKRAYEELARELGVTLGDIQKALEVIRSLDPRPGSKFNAEKAIYIEPDVFIVRDGDEYRVVLNEENLPKLRINSSYQRLLGRGSNIREETKSYIRDHINGAKWLLKSFVQRQQTINKVVESIVQRQKEFLDKGIEHLRPMILSDVAFDIGMHESTVSRVVTNKYAYTPRGVLELKFFFSTGIRSTTGEDISNISVKRKIKQIIEGENSHKPLSDSKIMAILNREGLKIARRTVAKYREEQRIPPSKLRKSVF
jgi:RNA polymerase sigma-54 factor